MGEHSFPRNNRLLSSVEFDNVFTNKEYSVTKGSFLILAVKNKLGYNRLGMLIAKKTLPRAVDRNYMKRQIRECFRHLDPLNIDIVALARPGIFVGPNSKVLISEALRNLKQKVIS